MIHCFYWSNLHFVSTHIAEGGASQNFVQNGIFSSAEIHEREPSGLFLLEGTRMTDLMLRLTLSYLSRGRKINCTHRREPPTHLYSQCTLYRGQKPWQPQSTSVHAEATSIDRESHRIDLTQNRLKRILRNPYGFK